MSDQQTTDTASDYGPAVDPHAPSAGPTGSVADRSQVEVERHLGDEGFTGQFGARDGARVLCFTCHREFPAAELDADLARRVERESDPSDMAIVVPVVCPHCGAPGTLALQFGPMASIEESDVIAQLPRAPSSYDPTAATDGDTPRTQDVNLSGSGREAQPTDTSDVDRAREDAERLERDHHGADDSAAINPGRTQASTEAPDAAGP